MQNDNAKSKMFKKFCLPADLLWQAGILVFVILRLTFIPIAKRCENLCRFAPKIFLQLSGLIRPP